MESASVTVDCECCAKRFDPSAVDVQTHGRNGGGRGGGGGGGGSRLIEVSSMGVKESSLQNGRIRYRTDENGRISHSLSKSESLLGIEGGRAVAAAAVAAAAAAAAASDAEQGNDSVGTRDDDVDDNDDESICNAVTQLDVSENKSGTCKEIIDGIEYVVYESELQMPDIIRLITKDLSEPYSIYTYRYFIHNWPKLCFLAMDSSRCVGAIVCKLDLHKRVIRRGYIAMLAVDAEYRRKKIGSNLVLKAIRAMLADGCDEVVLETEITNRAALRLYENLGFVRDKRLFRYYLNGVDALRLKLWLR